MFHKAHSWLLGGPVIAVVGLYRVVMKTHVEIQEMILTELGDCESDKSRVWETTRGPSS